MSSASEYKTAKTRKRKVFADSSLHPSQSWPKYRRSDTRSRRRNVKSRSLSCTESYTEDDNASNSLACVSTSATSEKSASSQKYEFLAAKFNISSCTVKKYFSVLTSKPRVPIIRTVSIKKELSPIRYSQALKMSPVLGSRKKIRKPRIKVGPKQKSVSENVNKTASRNLQNYFQTLEDRKIKEEPCSPDELPCPDFSSEMFSQSKTTSFTNNRWEKLIDHNSSSDEFEVSKSLHFTKSIPSSSLDKNGIVANPFSKVKRKLKKNLQNSENLKQQKKSFWLKNFGKDTPISKKKKFIETFEIKKKRDNETDTDNEVVFMGFPSATNVVKDDKTKKRALKRIKRMEKAEGSKTSVACAGSLADSLSVNCQTLFNLTSIEVKDTINVNSLSSNLIHSSFPTSFGAGSSDDEEQNTEDSVDDGKADSFVQDINDDQYCSNIMNNGKNCEEQPCTSTDSVKTVDILDSSPKLDSTPRHSSTTPSEDPVKLKGKPIIISDNLLPNNTIVLPTFKNIRQQRLNKNISPTKTNGLQNSSLKAINGESSSVEESSNPNSEDTPNQLEFNGVSRNLIDLKTSTPKARNSTTEENLKSTSLSPVQINVNNPPKVEEDNISLVDIEESFDSLCQEVSQMSSNVNITLYKDQGDDTSEKCEKVVLRAPKKIHSDFKVPTMFKSPSEATESTSTKSPTTFQRSHRLRLSLRSHQPAETETNVSSPQTSNRQQLNSKNQISSLRTAAATESTGFQFGSTGNSNRMMSPRFQNKDPRLNRSISPVKSLGMAQVDSRLNRSISPVKSSAMVNTDPRLNRSISPVKFPVMIIADPRLNRSISPVKSMGMFQLDPRLNRSMSQSDDVVIKDPRLRKNFQPLPSTVPTTPQQITDSSNDLSTTKIIDPRLRKRKEREEAERRKSLSSTENVKQEQTEINDSDISTAQIKETPAQAIKRRRLSVFHRLGSKSLSASPEKEVDSVKNELLNIVRNIKKESPKKMMNYDSDDDGLSLHPNDSFSSDEESNASPRHRKFTSERTRVNEEIRHQPISIKDRLWSAPGLSGANRKPIVPPSTVTMTTAKTNITTTTSNIKSRLTLNAGNQRQSTPAASSLMQTLTKPEQPGTSGTAGVPNAGKKRIPFSEYSNNDVSFNQKFYEMNAAQMLKDEDNLRVQDSGETPYVTFDNGDTEKPNKFDNVSILDAPTELAVIGANETRTSFFNGYCYRMLRKGKCLNELTNCSFSHQMICLQKLIKQKRLNLLVIILDNAIASNFEYFLLSVWSSILPTLQNDAFSIYEKLYQGNQRSERFIHEFLEYCIGSKLHTVESFIKRISPIIQKGDKITVHNICAAVKSRLRDGFCWEAIKDLSQKAVPPHDMIELTLIQCLNRKKNNTHIMEVFNLVKNKISAVERFKISQSLLKQFYNLVQSRGTTVDSKDTLNTQPLMNVTNNGNTVPSKITRNQSVDSIQSLENESSVSQPVNTVKPLGAQIASPAKSYDSCVQPNNSPLETQNCPVNRGESANFTEYTVMDVDSEEPKSVFRDRFWKLYLTLHNVNEGLHHADYDYVWKVLDEFSKEDVSDELLKRTYYHILCKNVKNCERHITQIVKRAVHCRWSTSRKSIDMLFDVGVCALIDLADSDLWVMALQLLNSLRILEPEEPRAEFVLISAEIYLANSDPLEALYLLQRTRLIRTNRDEWLVIDSTKGHEKHRNKVIFILLKALSYTEPEKAVYLFKTLMEDQYISYYPVDLTLYLDKLTLLLLLHNKEDLAADMCRIIMDNDLTFQKATYQELIRKMLPVDEIFAIQILDYAVHLGYYNDIQIRNGFSTIILDTNYCEEEVYLILKRLIQKLTLCVGPVIQRLKPHQLKVIIIFEDIPMEKRLYKNEITVMDKNKYKNFQILISNILKTRFTPPIRIAYRRTEKICKVVGRTLVDYLKHWI